MPGLNDRQPVYLRCKACGLTWIAAWLPMSVSTFATLLKRAACAQCGETKQIFMYEPGTVPPPPAEEPA
jgi:hypothetical protein